MKKILVVAILAVCAGCMYRGAKVTEGTDLAIGMDLPMAEGAIHFNALNYLSGFRLGIDRNAALTVKYTVHDTGSFFGCVTTDTTKTIDASVTPLSGAEEK